MIKQILSNCQRRCQNLTHQILQGVVILAILLVLGMWFQCTNVGSTISSKLNVVKAVKFTEPAIAALCKMCATNLFRVFPPKFRTSTTGGETEDEEPMFDPAWSHLQIVYDLLLQFINYNSLDVKVAKAHFIDKDQRLASSVIKGLLKYWPVTNSQKELMFISELEEILEMTSMLNFRRLWFHCFDEWVAASIVLITRLFSSTLIAFLINNLLLHLVAERAHLLWNNEHILNLITQNRQVILPLVFSALVHNSQNHWNQAVLNLTQNIKKMLSQMDEELGT
ncbi:Protein phosphatase 2A, regulatory B subunit, B56 [Sesbania bispinosa]|nr:Protein phosphatase 2A, regulatory B subunit, B56 [Sesbania bispinosa]